jgi:hypothetical protein
MEIHITRTTPVLRTPSKSGVFVQWNISSPSSSGIAKFTLERSGSPEGPFELVIDELNDFHFFDDLRQAPLPEEDETRENLNFLSLSRSIYYRVTVTAVNGTTASTVQGIGATIVSRKLMLLRRKIQRDLSVAFKFNAVDIAILKRKHWGIRCTDCFDQLTKKVTNSKCETCFGTGFKDGYFNPVRIKGRFGVKNVQTDITPQGKADINKTRFYALTYPELEVDDVIVDIRQNKRYIIQTRHATEMQTQAVHQTCTISELARDSIEYRVVADFDVAPMLY